MFWERRAFPLDQLYCTNPFILFICHTTNTGVAHLLTWINQMKNSLQLTVAHAVDIWSRWLNAWASIHMLSPVYATNLIRKNFLRRLLVFLFLLNLSQYNSTWLSLIEVGCQLVIETAFLHACSHTHFFCLYIHQFGNTFGNNSISFTMLCGCDFFLPCPHPSYLYNQRV